MGCRRRCRLTVYSSMTQRRLLFTRPAATFPAPALPPAPLPPADFAPPPAFIVAPALVAPPAAVPRPRPAALEDSSPPQSSTTSWSQDFLPVQLSPPRPSRRPIWRQRSWHHRS